MSNPQNDAKTATAQEQDAIERASDLRKGIANVISDLDAFVDFITQHTEKRGIAEAIISKRELQSARHWLGEVLSYYPTGYRVTDNPKDPGSESKAVGVES